VFLITHDLDTLYEICDRVAVIADKRVIAVGTIPNCWRSITRGSRNISTARAAARPSAARHARQGDGQVADRGA
jgi:phospholipid/cholesterol/gamma-HCH transport system ATP-binding protein